MWIKKRNKTDSGKNEKSKAMNNKKHTSLGELGAKECNGNQRNTSVYIQFV